jgi:hypothetical protein
MCNSIDLQLYNFKMAKAIWRRFEGESLEK